jgi:hypothetical protein
MIDVNNMERDMAIARINYCWRCILTPSRDLAYIEAAAPINPICVQLLHQLPSFSLFFFDNRKLILVIYRKNVFIDAFVLDKIIRIIIEVAISP